MSIEREDRDGMLRVLDPSGIEERHIGRPFAGVILHEKQAKAIADALIAAGFSRRPEPVMFELGGTFTTVNNLPIRME